MRFAYRILRFLGDLAALNRGPAAFGKRLLRRQAHRELARWMR